jgi:hypothetical protein
VSTALGLRGIGAKPKRGSSADLPTSSEPHSWEAAGLSRAERVIRFVESLPITSGPLAGTALRAVRSCVESGDLIPRLWG